MSQPIWINEADVVAMMALPDAIDALRDGLREEASGAAINMVKTHAIWGEGATLHAIGAVFERVGYVGTKTWVHAPGGAMPVLIVFNAADGSIAAIIEAFALGQMRTGGISGLATDLMARPEASRMAMLGSGKQSITQVAAVAAVRELDHVSVWSPTSGKREALAAKITATLGLPASACESSQEATGDADIVTIATRAREPFVFAKDLAPGVHVNAVGAITPERAEFGSGLLDHAGLVAADSVAQVRNLSHEFIEAYGNEEARWQNVIPLCQLAAHGVTGRAKSDLSLFKAMGMGISDLSLGIAVLEMAREQNRGRPIPATSRVAPRLQR